MGYSNMSCINLLYFCMVYYQCVTMSDMFYIHNKFAYMSISLQVKAMFSK